MSGQCPFKPCCIKLQRPKPNAKFWFDWVHCTKIFVDKRQEETELLRFFRHKDEEESAARWLKVQRLVLTCPPDHALKNILDRKISAFAEWRQFWKWCGVNCPKNWITYHSFMLLEVEGEEQARILLEKKTSQLELMFGIGELSHGFLKEFRGTSPPRDPTRCEEQFREELQHCVTVRQLLEWIDGPLARRGQAYDLFRANCQHFAEQLKELLRFPDDVLAHDDLETQEQRELVLKAVTVDPEALLHAPEVLRNDRSMILQAIQLNGRALQHAPDNFPWDWSVALAAVTQDCSALEYVGEALRYDRNIVLTASRQNARAAKFLSEDVRQEKEIQDLLALNSAKVG